MSKSEIEQSPSKPDVFVEALEMEGATLSESISSRELEQLTEIQAQLADIDNDEDMEEIEAQEITDNASSKQNESEPDLDNNVVEVEIETEGERVEAPEEIVPEIKEKRPIVKKEVLSPTQIPIKPLTIAPKPTTITAQKLGTKTAVVTPGQQIVLIQSPGGTANAMTLGSGQQIKLVSPSGQTLTLPQLQAMGQQLIKTSDGNLVLKTGVQKLSMNANQTIKTASTTKRIIASAQPKKIIVGAQGQTQSIKIVTSSAGSSILNSPTKTISLAQAQQMGLITTSQLQQILPQSPNKQIIVSKAQPKTQVFKVGTSAFTKSPTKILPAPKLIQKTGQQKVVIRPSTQLKTGVVNSNQQLLRIPSGQLASTTGQIHQINVPGRGIQYVRLVSATSAPTSTTATSISTTSGTTQTLRVMSTQSQSKLQTIVPVALVNSTRQNQSGNTMPTNIIKVIPVSGTNQSVNQTVRTVTAKSGTTQTQRIYVPASSAQVGPTQIVQLQSQNQTAAVQKVPPKSITINSKVVTNAKPFIKQERVSSPEDSPEYVNSSQNRSSMEPNGLRPRKPCNCTKSQCLKLYCDCFANGEFCHMCNCVNCFNNLDFEEERQKAIKSCLERNPNAFRPKIGKGRDSGETVRKHTKGCNCKRSGCLKNYCECYEAKIACSSNCKCVGCRNIEDSMEKKSLRPLAPALSAVLDDPSMSSLLASMTKVSSSMSVKVAIPSLSKNRLQHGLSQQQTVSNFRPMLGDSTAKQAFKFMTDEVIEAICQCLLARADEAERNMLSAQEAERQVLEEFGRCLIEIIAISSSADNT